MYRVFGLCALLLSIAAAPSMHAIEKSGCPQFNCLDIFV